MKARSAVRRRRGKRFAVVGGAILVVVALLAISWGQAVLRPGRTSVRLRTALWVRDMGGSVLLDSVEWVYYTMHKPAEGARPASLPASDLPHPALAATAALPALPRVRLLPGAPPRPGEGRFQPIGRLVRGAPALWSTFFAADRTHGSVYVGEVWIDPTRVRPVIAAGTIEPKGFASTWGGQIPLAVRPSLVGAFNGGFRFDQADGGLFLDGRVVVPLHDDIASFVVHRDGRVELGAWGRDVRMTPDVVAVRQNLHLIVDHGRADPGLARNEHGEWSTWLNQGLYTWRSGLGIDRNGALIYVAGDALTLESLGDALARGGAVRAMELDIHEEWVTFDIYEPAATPALVRARKLMPGMAGDPHHFLEPFERDFVALLER